MFRHRRQLQRWASTLLLVWLLGITAGVANACLAACIADTGGLQTDGARDAAAAPDELAAPPCALHQRAADRQGASKADCLDFCAKSTVSIPSLKSALDHADNSALPHLDIAMVCPIPALSPVPLPTPRRDGAAAPPIRIAFLRLAL